MIMKIFFWKTDDKDEEPDTTGSIATETIINHTEAFVTLEVAFKVWKAKSIWQHPTVTAQVNSQFNYDKTQELFVPINNNWSFFCKSK